MNNKALIWIVVAILAIGAIVLFTNKQEPVSDTTPDDSTNQQQQSQTEPVTVQLLAQNNSGQQGIATLTPMNGQTEVKIQVANGPVTPEEPAHIHVGSCPTPGAVKYNLNNVVSGMSTTTLNVELEDLLAELPLAINIHQSSTNMSNYMACGNIGAATATPTPTPTATPTAKTVTVNMTADGFSPATITINKGDTVTFVNQDNKTRWPASAPHPSHTDYPEFDPKKGVAAGSSWSFTFDQTGTWRYHDHLNSGIFGSVTVQ